MRNAHRRRLLYATWTFAPSIRGEGPQAFLLPGHVLEDVLGTTPGGHHLMVVLLYDGVDAKVHETIRFHGCLVPARRRLGDGTGSTSMRCPSRYPGVPLAGMLSVCVRGILDLDSFSLPWTPLDDASVLLDAWSVHRRPGGGGGVLRPCGLPSIFPPPPLGSPRIFSLSSPPSHRIRSDQWWGPPRERGGSGETERERGRERTRRRRHRCPSGAWHRRRKTEEEANRHSPGSPSYLRTNANPRSAGKSAKGAVPWSKSVRGNHTQRNVDGPNRIRAALRPGSDGDALSGYESFGNRHAWRRDETEPATIAFLGIERGQLGGLGSNHHGARTYHQAKRNEIGYHPVRCRKPNPEKNG
eukprot:scaffold718_cov342-Pavlova_lutheri.AAC.21